MQKHSVLILLIFALCTVGAFGASFSTTNVRPISPLGVSSEPNLQSLLDQIYGSGNMDVISGQQKAAMFKEGSGSQVAPTLQFEYAGDSESVGIFSGTDSSSLTLVNIFNPRAMPLGAAKIFATVAWVDPTHINVYSDFATCLSGVVNCTAAPVAGISQSFFGFYLQDGPNTYYTPDSLNGGTARVLSYRGMPENLWTFAFEDGTDFDYNDRVFSVESITPIPEPASVILFGTLLVLCASGLRRRRAS